MFLETREPYKKLKDKSKRVKELYQASIKLKSKLKM